MGYDVDVTRLMGKMRGKGRRGQVIGLGEFVGDFGVRSEVGFVGGDRVGERPSRKYCRELEGRTDGVTDRGSDRETE